MWLSSEDHVDISAVFMIYRGTGLEYCSVFNFLTSFVDLLVDLIW